MYYDSFDICLAHWAYATAWHEGQGSATYAKFSQLHRLRFSPGLCQSADPRHLGENAREIYRQLIVKRCGLHSTGTRAGGQL
jgi:hypothetical protein